jgi:hypothetical protein
MGVMTDEEDISAEQCEKKEDPWLSDADEHTGR